MDHRETRRRPDGHITVNGKRMAYWLPAGVSAEDLGLAGADPDTGEAG